MILKCGTIIPFQYKDTKKLVVVNGKHLAGEITACDIKNAVCSTFTVRDCEFYNKKIGFQIPTDLIIPYLQQRQDLTNFVIEIVEIKDSTVLEKQSSDDESLNEEEEAARPLNSNDSKRILEISDDDDVPVVKRIKPVNDSVDRHLESLLTTEGLEICHNFEAQGELTEKDRLLLTKLITTSEFDNLVESNSPLAIDNQRYLDLATAIVNKFSGEDSSTYYVPACKGFRHMASGRLCEYFNVLKCRYLEMEGHNRYKQRAVDTDFPELENLLEIINDWLPYFTAWQESFELRMAYVRNVGTPLRYFQKFIANVEENAIKLVEADFERLYPQKAEKLLNSWDHICERIFTEAIISCRNDVPLILDLYGNIPQLSGFMMLGYFLENFEGDVKAFAKDDSGNLIVHIETLDEKPVDVFKNYCNNQNQVSPMVFVTGKKTNELSFFVLVGDNLYCFETALKAVDFCFKCYQILQLSYPTRQRQVWQVIQKALYDIHKEEDGFGYENFLSIFKSS